MATRDAARDEDIGLTAFLTTTPPLGGRLKFRVEDFRVDEVGGLPAEDPNGPFVCAVVRLTNWETNQFVNAASDALHVSRKKIHFSGTKDKRGVTTRAFTFEAPEDAVQALAKFPGVSIERTYRCSRESALGDHTQNSFEIVLRDLASPPEAVREAIGATWTSAMEAGGFPNVFGPQRFGAVRATTHRVGERMIRGDFHGAVYAYLGTAPLGLDDAARSDWATALGTRDYPALLRLCRGDQGFERALLHRLVERPEDAIDALRALPKNLQLLFVYAYQSYLFNRIVCGRIEAGLGLAKAHEGDLVAPVEGGIVGDEWVPVTARNVATVQREVDRGRGVLTGLLPGMEVPEAKGRPGEIERAVLADADVTPSEFVIPEHLEWSSKGTRRALTLRPLEFEFDVGPDELFPGRTRARFQFALPRGAYATSVLREIMKAPTLADYA